MWNPESKDALNYLKWSDFFESTLLMNKEDHTSNFSRNRSLLVNFGRAVSLVIITICKNPQNSHKLSSRRFPFVRTDRLGHFRRF